MTPLRWYSRVRLLGWLAGVSWEVFCFASGYPRQGHVCDWYHLDPLPCDLVKAEEVSVSLRAGEPRTSTPGAAAENEIGCAALLDGEPRNYWTWDKLAEYRAALDTEPKGVTYD